MADAITETKPPTAMADEKQIDAFIQSLSARNPDSSGRPLWLEQRERITTNEYITGPIDEEPSLFSLQMHGQDLILTRLKTLDRDQRNQVSGTIYLFQPGVGQPGRFIYQAEFEPGQYEELLSAIKSGMLQGGPQQLPLAEFNKLHAMVQNRDKHLIVIGGQP